MAQEAMQLILEADALQLAGSYEASNKKFDKAKIVLSETGEQSTEWFYCVNKTGLNHCRLGNYQLADSLMGKNIEATIRILGESNLETARAYYIQSLVNIYQGSFSFAIELGNKALDIRLTQLPTNDGSILEVYNSLGLAYLYTRKQAKAYEFIQKALKIEPETDHHQERAYAYIVSGCYFFGIDNMKATEDFEKALAIADEHLPPSNFAVLWAYLCLGSNYINMGHYAKALDYTQKALQLSVLSKSEKSERNSMLLINTAKIYKQKKDYEKAFRYFHAVEDIYKEIYDKDNTHIAKFYNYFGQYYAAVNENKKALDLLNRSIEIWNKEAKKGYGWIQNVNITLNATADLYFKTGKYKEAETIYQKALSLDTKDIPAAHGIPLVLVSTCNKLSKLFFAQYEYEQAIHYTQKAIALNRQAIGENQIISEPLSLLTSLNNQINIKAGIFKQDNNPVPLKEAYQTGIQCEQLVGKQRNFYQEYEDRIEFNDKVHETFENAIEVCFLLYKETNNAGYSHKAFDYFESSKAHTLLQSIQEMQALRYANVPDSILEKERELKVKISHHERMLNQVHVGEKDEQLKKHKEALFEYKEQYRQLIQKLEKDYPAYYQLKYQPQETSIEDIQQYLDSKTAVINFFEGEKSIYSLIIQKNNTHFFKFDKSESWQTVYNNFHKAVSNKDMALDNAWINSTYDLFTTNAHQLYKDLFIAPMTVLETDIECLQIIPDGLLNYIPFELLLKTKAPDGQLNYRNLDYLLRHFAFGYAYSATLLLEQQIGKTTTSQHTYGGFAPVYYNETTKALEGLVAEYKENKVYSYALREGLMDLPDARKSVAKIAEILKGKAVLAKEATKKCFLELSGNFKILHLAMHGLVDHENPLYSKLVFTSEDGSQDHLLEAGDLYNMEINAQLAVLSACNTGYGKMQKGEGVMSLSRAFTYAGCPSVVMSLWSVPDMQTADIMVRFFKGLKAGFTKDKALQKAKLDYLETSPFSESHPLFWAGFVPSGDMCALDDL